MLSQNYARVRFPAAPLTSPCFSSIKEGAAVAATRGDLGQLAPRKKLLKSEKSSQKVSETLQALWQGGFLIFPPCCPNTTDDYATELRAFCDSVPPGRQHMSD